MKLSRFIVMFVGCVAFFAMLFQPQEAMALLKQLQPSLTTYRSVSSVDSSFELENPKSDFPKLGFDREVNIETEMEEVFGFITSEIECSGKINANETKGLLNNVKAAMKGQPFVPTYATEENMDLLEECVDTVEFIYGTPKCKQLNVKIVEIKKNLLPINP